MSIRLIGYHKTFDKIIKYVYANTTIRGAKIVKYNKRYNCWNIGKSIYGPSNIITDYIMMVVNDFRRILRKFHTWRVVGELYLCINCFGGYNNANIDRMGKYLGTNYCCWCKARDHCYSLTNIISRYTSILQVPI